MTPDAMPPDAEQVPPQAPPAGPQLPPMPQRPTNVVTIDRVMKLMRDDRMRSFRIDIETDSTVQTDENEYKQRMGEFMTAIGTFVEQVLPAGETHPELVPFLGEAMLTVVRGFRVGRQLEGAIEDAVATLEEKAQQGGGPPPNPEMVKAQQDAAHKDKELAANQQMEQQRLQAENDRHAATLDFERQKHADEMSLKEGEQAHKQQMERDTIPADASGPVADQLAMIAQQLQGLAQSLEQAQMQHAQSVLSLQDQHAQGVNALQGQIGAVADEMSAPKQIVYGEDGRPAGVAGPRGVRPIARDETGRTVGLA